MYIYLSVYLHGRLPDITRIFHLKLLPHPQHFFQDYGCGAAALYRSRRGDVSVCPDS